MDVTPSQEDKKEDPKSETRQDVDFFEERGILIDIEEGKSIVVFMRLLKIKEIPILNRVVYLQERDPANEQAVEMLADLAVNTLNVPARLLPPGIGKILIADMVEFNFSSKDKKPDETPDKKSGVDPESKKNELVSCFDFLIANGHNYSDILEYPVKRFDDFIEAIAERLGMKKKPLDAGDAFRKLGLPVKQRGAK